MPSAFERITDFVGITNSRANSVKEVQPDSTPTPSQKKEVLFQWTIATRPQVGALATPKFNRSFTVLGGFIVLLLILMQEFLLVAAIGSMVFLWYALSASPVEVVTHTITNQGVEFAGELYAWEELSRFFFTKTGTMDTLCIDTKERLPGRLFFMVESSDREKIKELVGRYLTYLEEQPKDFTDRMYDRIVNRISLDGK